MKQTTFVLHILFVVILIPLSASAADKQWFVSVFGENLQTIEGASSTPSINNGQFLDLSFVGKEIYVRSKEHYELDQFRPEESENLGEQVVVASAVGGNSPEKPKLTTEFGPLTDTGVQYALNGDFHGWSCSHLFVKPMGGRTYRLRCETNMTHE